MVIVLDSPFKEKVFHYIHAHPLAEHSRYLRMYQRAKQDFYWTEMKRDIEKLVRECKIC